jgi:hypothetical protein
MMMMLNSGRVLRGCATPQAGFKGTEPFALGEPDMFKPEAQSQNFTLVNFEAGNGVVLVASCQWNNVLNVSGNCIERVLSNDFKSLLKRRLVWR